MKEQKVQKLVECAELGGINDLDSRMGFQICLSVFQFEFIHGHFDDFLVLPVDCDGCIKDHIGWQRPSVSLRETD